MLVTGESVSRGMARRAAELGYAPIVLSTTLEGEAAHVGRLLGQLARECARRRRPFDPPCALIGCGGESTVAVGAGGFGAGGPNQELALAAALALEPSDPIAIASVDTDGCDGATRYAGALVDGASAGRIRAEGADAEAALREHRSTAALSLSGDLIDTGPTGTNVNDAFVAIVDKAPL
jgi:glycerate 2-kinase